MGILQRFERRLEDLVTGIFARTFTAEVAPVEIAAALRRECDDRATVVSRDRTIVPNTYVVELSSGDADRLGPYFQALGEELANILREHASAHRFSFPGPLDVTFDEVPVLETGIFHIRSAAVTPAAGVAAVAPDAAEAAAALPAPAAAPPAPVPAPVAAEALRAHLELGSTVYPLTAYPAVLGRSGEAAVKLDDPGVSRRHAQIERRGDQLWLVDLDSTNGTLLDGSPVSEHLLRDGSEIRLGSTSLRVRLG